MARSILKALPVAAVSLLACAALWAKDAPDPTPSKDADPFPISVRAAPALVLAARAGGAAGNVLTISGDTLPNGQRSVAITIATEAGAVVATHQVRPDAKGRYSFAAPVPSQAGGYRVAVVAPDGLGKASTSFKAVDAGGLGAQAETVLNDALAAAQDGVNAAEAKIDALTESPAKDQAKKQIAEAKRGLAELRSAGGGSAVKGIIGAISYDPALQESFRPRLDALATGFADTARETERVRKLTAEMSSADIGCHRLAVVTELFKGVAAVLGAKGKVFFAVTGLAREFVDASMARRAKAPAAAAATDSAAEVKKNQPALDLAYKTIGGPANFLTNLGAYISGNVFGTYCEQYVGPIEGIMNARFFNSSAAAPKLTEWWSYNYKISGRVILYYPKGAQGNMPVRLNGRIEGYAHGFDTWEDALTVMFPKLMAGAIQKKYSFPPIEAGMVPSPAGKAAPGSDYAGSAATSLAIPNSFLMNVTGVLEKDSMTIVLGPMQSDIDATHRVAVVILSPLSGGAGPQVTWYPLPFLKVRPFLLKVADGESLKLGVKPQGDKMVAERVFTGNTDKPKGKAEFTLKMKLCNPGC